MSARAALALVLALAFAVLAGLALYWRGNAIAAEAAMLRIRAERDQAVAANADNLRTIEALQEQARFDGRLVASLIDEMRQVSAAVAEVAEQQQELKDGNQEVREFLGTRVPSDLRRLRGR